MRAVLTLLGVLAGLASASAQEVERHRDPTLPHGLPFSTAVRAGDTVYLSGHIGRDRETGQLAGRNIETQTRQALENVVRSLGDAGGERQDIVKCTVFLTDLDQFDGMNAAYSEFFGREFPARSTVEVAGLVLDALVEIECIAYVPHTTQE